MSSPPMMETDYLVMGAGASAMSFVDTLLSESTANVVIVDRRGQPGGHWNDAYPFVRLHQPSAYYGVNSRPLGSGAIDTDAWNRGMYELGSAAEIVDYFAQVMNRRFLPSGRVRFLAKTELEQAGTDASAEEGVYQASCLVTGAKTQIRARKLVDATRARTEVPSTHPPKYRVAPGVKCVPINDLPRIQRPHSGYVVVGSGKTGCDAILWLLKHGVAPAAITWIMPRDPWLMDRKNLQPGAEWLEQSITSLMKQFDALAQTTSLPELFARLEADGQLVRLDPRVEPTTYRCSITSDGEVAELRRIENVVRLGRLIAVEPDRLVLERGTVVSDPDRLIVDCSACAIPYPETAPVFEGNKIHLQFVAICQMPMSAAVIACVESHVTDEVEKNALCRVVPVPSVPSDWVAMWTVFLGNRLRWMQHPILSAFLVRSRLDRLASTIARIDPSDLATQDLMKRYRQSTLAALAQLPRWMAELAATPAPAPT